MAKTVFEIDLNNLDREWNSQPELYRDHARQLADARHAHAVAKAYLDLTEADLSLNIRKRPEEFGLEKVTDPAIKATVIVQEDYQKALEDLNNKKHEVDLLDADVEALQHRKKALEKEVDLFLTGYFSTPRERKDENGRPGHTVEDMAASKVRRGKKVKK